MLFFLAYGLRDTIGLLIPAAPIFKSHWRRSFTLAKWYKQKIDFLEK